MKKQQLQKQNQTVKKKAKGCSCLDDVEQRTINHLKERLEKQLARTPNYLEDESGFVNRVILFGNNNHIPLAIPFELLYHRIKVDGTPEKNVSKEKTNLFVSYCPFCGRKITQDND